MLSASAFLKKPEMVDAFDGETVSAAVTIEDDGVLTIEMSLPLVTLRDAGMDELDDDDELVENASLWTSWELDGSVEVVDLAVPTDVAADPSCGE